MPDKEIQIKFSEWADRINTSHAEVKQSYQSTLQHARACGELIMTVYSQIDQGSRLRWLAKHCPDIAPATAQIYIKVFQEWKTIESRPDIRTIGAAKKLLTKSKVESNKITNPKSTNTATGGFPALKVATKDEVRPPVVRPQPASVPKPEVRVKSSEDEVDSLLEQVHDLQIRLKKLTIERDTLTDKVEELESNLKTYRLIRKKIGDDWENFIENLGL